MEAYLGDPGDETTHDPPTLLMKCNSDRYPDIQVQDEGTIVLFHTRTDAGAKWIGEHIPEDSLFLGQALAVEHRFASDVINGMIESGLMVKL